MVLEREGVVVEREGVEREGVEREGVEREGVEREGVEREGVDREGVDREGVDREGVERDRLEPWDDRLELCVRLPWELLRLFWAKASAEGRASRRIRVVVIRGEVLMVRSGRSSGVR